MSKLVFWICILLLNKNFYVTHSSPHSPIFLTQDDITPSIQQAAGSSIKSVINYMAPLGVPRWTYVWKIDNGTQNITIGNVSIQSLTVQFQVVSNPYSNLLTFSNTPSQLTTPSDTVVSSVTMQNLLPVHTGIKFWFFASAVPPRRSYPELQVLYCPQDLGTRAILTSSTIPCGFGCTGTFTCPLGYTSNFQNTATCLPNATWDINDFDCIPGTSNVDMTTVPPIETLSNIYAVGASNVVVPFTATVSGQTNCFWNYSYIGNYNNYSNSFQVSTGSNCIVPSTNNINVTVDCVNLGGIISTNLTFDRVLEFGRIDAMFICGSSTLFLAILNIVFCQDFEDGIFIDRSSAFCGFGCIGAYTCPPGYLTKDSPPLISCNKFARWNVSREFCIQDRLRRWSFKPFNSTVYAVGYPALSIEAEVYQSNSISCRWIYDGELSNSDFLNQGICAPLLKGRRDAVYCQSVNASIIGELRIDGPLGPGLIDIKFVCNGFTFLNTRVSIEYCKEVQDTALIVSNQLDCGYACIGTSVCLTSSDFSFLSVSCSAVAKWNISGNCLNGSTSFHRNEIGLLKFLVIGLLTFHFL